MKGIYSEDEVRLEPKAAWQVGLLFGFLAGVIVAVLFQLFSLHFPGGGE